MTFLSPPPKAHTRKNGDDDGDNTPDEPGITSGVEVTSKEGQRRRKKSERKMHKIEPKKPKPKPSFDSGPSQPVTTYLKEQAKTQKENDFIFLLWGSICSEVAPTYAVDVTITGDHKTRANREIDLAPWRSYGTFRVDRYLREEAVFSLLKRQYYAEIGLFRRYLFFRKVARVRVVNFRFISRTHKRFRVSMNPVDFSCFQKKFDETAARTDEKINWDGSDWDEDPDELYRCADCGHSSCEPDYELIDTEGDDCPGRERQAALDKLQWAQSADLLTFYFRDPALARGQNMLSSAPYNLFGQWKQMEYFGGTFQRNWSEKGLYIETCFDTTKLLRTTIVLLILVTVLGKLAWGSWDIVFGAGSFCVAIPMLVLTAFSYTDS